MDFSMISFLIVISKYKSCSKGKRELQEELITPTEPTTPMAPIERSTNSILLSGKRSFISEL